MKLMIDTDAEPVAYHSPIIPVPLHWQDDVKGGLYRVVRLGVLEPVPVGEPVTLCHRMVICAKKNASHAGPLTSNQRDQSPFHQVRSVPHGKKKI